MRVLVRKTLPALLVVLLASLVAPNVATSAAQAASAAPLAESHSVDASAQRPSANVVYAYDRNKNEVSTWAYDNERIWRCKTCGGFRLSHRYLHGNLSAERASNVRRGWQLYGTPKEYRRAAWDGKNPLALRRSFTRPNGTRVILSLAEGVLRMYQSGVSRPARCDRSTECYPLE